MPGRELTDDEKRDLRARFEAAGISVIQIALSSGGLSPLVDYPTDADTRVFAKEWLGEELKRTMALSRRNSQYLRWGTTAAVIAAVAAVIAAIPIVENWLR